VVIVTLPLAMLIAFLLMQHFGLSANLMSLAGLAIGIGMMVDGAVVMVENGFRLLSHQAGKTVNRTHVILEAAREVINPSPSPSSSSSSCSCRCSRSPAWKASCSSRWR
jgi:cobalt-zinc-cadmium resistance protein CzcA